MKINTRIAERLAKINPSSTLAITAKANKLKADGRDVVSFAAGEPDFDTPEPIKAAAINAINSGFTKYTPTTGTQELKAAIVNKFKKENNLTYAPHQIVVSCGAKHSIFNTLFVLVEAGDEVIIPSPYWVSYPEMVNLCQASPKLIKTSAANGFKMTPRELKTYIGPKTKALILNSPSNPTGCVYTENELRAIADICVCNKMFVISDEIYEKMIYDNIQTASIASFNKDIYDLTITVNGLSKSHAMTGWRIGYIGGPADIIAAISKFQDHSTSNPVSISQKAAVAALAMPDEATRAMTAEFQKRRDYIVQRISAMTKISCVIPRGAFYIFCDISKTGLDSMTIATRLLDEQMVAVIPGIAFGNDDCIRLSFATGLKQIEKGMDRLELWLNKL